MALRLNFVYEIEELARERQRDPLKLGMYVLGAIILLCLVFYFFRWQAVSANTAARRSMERKWGTLEKTAASARQRTVELKETLRMDAVLTNATKQRFFWAPRLQRLFESVPPQVEINNLSGSVNQDTPPDQPRVFSFIIDGRAAGPVPLIAAEEFRQHLIKRFQPENQSSLASFRRLAEPEPPQQVVLSGSTLGVSAFTISLDVAEPALSGTEGK